jgi:hypothetical protein
VVNKTAANIQYSGAVTVEALKPAEPAATDGATIGTNVRDSTGSGPMPRARLANDAIRLTAEPGQLFLLTSDAVSIDSLLLDDAGIAGAAYEDNFRLGGPFLKTSAGVDIGDADALNAYAPDNNLFGDPNFQDYPGVSWASSTPGITLGGGTTAPFVTLAHGATRQLTTQMKPCAPGWQIDGQLDIYPDAGVTDYAGLYVSFYDGAGTLISQELVVQATAAGLTASVWNERLRGRSPPAPAGTQFVAAQLQSLTVNTGTAWNIRRQRAYIAELATGYLDTDGRALDAMMLSTGLLLGVTNTVNVTATATDQGGSTGVLVEIPAHTRRVHDATGVRLINYDAGSVPDRPYSTVGHIYAVDPTGSGGAVTYLWTTDENDLIGRHIYHATSIATPASGGAATDGDPGGGWFYPGFQP